MQMMLCQVSPLQVYGNRVYIGQNNYSFCFTLVLQSSIKVLLRLKVNNKGLQKLGPFCQYFFFKVSYIDR